MEQVGLSQAAQAASKLGEGWTMTQLAQSLGIERTEARELLAQLVALGSVEQAGKSYGGGKTYKASAIC